MSKFSPDIFVFERFKYLMFLKPFNLDILTLVKSIFDKSSLCIFLETFKRRFSFLELKELPKYLTSIKLDSALTFSILKSFSKRFTKFFFEGGATYVFRGGR